MRTCTLVIALVFLLSAGSSSTASTGDALASLRVNEPLEAVVAGLETFIPASMEQEGMPMLPGYAFFPECAFCCSWPCSAAPCPPNF